MAASARHAVAPVDQSAAQNQHDQMEARLVVVGVLVAAAAAAAAMATAEMTVDDAYSRVGEAAAAAADRRADGRRDGMDGNALDDATGPIAR